MPRTPVTSNLKSMVPQAASRTCAKAFVRPYQQRRMQISVSSTERTAGGASARAARRTAAALSDSSTASAEESAVGLPVVSVEATSAGGPGAAASRPRELLHVWSTGMVVACMASSASPDSRLPRRPLAPGMPARSPTLSLKSHGLCPKPLSEASARLSCHVKAQRLRQTSSDQPAAAGVLPAPPSVAAAVPLLTGSTPNRAAASQR
mmetsp:Transcript_75337/g.243638  ORF Transcript_75337/g.243638 Transcript_75337/m.243638 type:complete len:207 (-) Transcript_75337:559-1179(-)